LTDFEFDEGLPVGPNSYGWEIQAQPSEDESFGPGDYPVTFAICEGDCTVAHRWGGIYAQATTKFTITGN